MKNAKLPLLVVFLLVGLAGHGTAHQSAPMPAAKLENMLRVALADEFTPDREVIVTYVEIPPNVTMERHWHPGEEFHYYLEGEVEIAIDGKPSIIGKPGTIGHVPYKTMHTAITKEKPAKLIVFRVHTKGKPVRYLEKGGTSEQ